MKCQHPHKWKTRTRAGTIICRKCRTRTKPLKKHFWKSQTIYCTAGHPIPTTRSQCPECQTNEAQMRHWQKTPPWTPPTPTPCTTSPNKDAWTTNKPDTRHYATQHCQQCPHIQQCLEAGIQNKENGTWGGTWLNAGKPTKKATT